MGTTRAEFDGNKAERRNLDCLRRRMNGLAETIRWREAHGKEAHMERHEFCALEWAIGEIERIRAVETFAGWQS